MNKEITTSIKPITTSTADAASSPTTVSTEKVKLGGSLSNLGNAGRDINRTPAKMRRSRSFKTFNFAGLVQSMDPEPRTPVNRDTRGSTTKIWTKSKSGRKFSFASPEDYLEYAKNRSSSNLAVGLRNETKVEKKTEIKVEKTAETKTETKEEKKPEERLSPRTGKNKNWTDKYRGRRKFSFASSEEYIEYARSKSCENLSVEKSEELIIKRAQRRNSEELIIKRAQKRNTNSTEFALPSTEFGENLDDTADVTIDVVADEEEQVPDIESNKTRAGAKDERKSCLHSKLTFSNIWRILLLWVVIVGIALVFKFQGQSGASVFSPITGTNNSEIPGCRLCPAGSSVHEPELEVFLGDFTCATLEEALAPQVYSCGEIEKLVGESSECSSEDEGCSDLKEAVDQCCLQDPDEFVRKQIKQTEQNANHFRLNGN